MDIKKLVREEMKYIISMRRYFHQNPEPSMKEYRTAERIAKELSFMGIDNEIVDRIGVIGYINRNCEGKTILLRADTDALQMQELTNITYKSKVDNVMHSCGHDGHIAMLLGAARILKKLENKFSGKIRLVFQPAEEVCLGAKKMISKGVLKGVDSVFGMHLTMEIPVGSFCASPGVRTTAANQFSIKLTGKFDTIEAAASTILALQTITSREINPQDLFALSCCIVDSKVNQLDIMGTCRYSNPSLKDEIENMISRIAVGICKNYEVDTIINVDHLTYPIVNSRELSEIATTSIEKLFGDNSHIDIPTHPVSEDFSFYLQKIDGLYVNLGANKKDMSLTYPNHSPYFEIEEESLFYGTGLYVQYTLDYLNIIDKF